MVMKYNEIFGDLIVMGKQGKFDVIAHGCNCFCTMKSGIALQMADAFDCDTFNLEDKRYEGRYNKLGQIDIGFYYNSSLDINVKIINCYIQYNYQGNKLIDYEALTLCLRKINFISKNLHIGLPQIGCDLAGGDWNIVKEIIKKELKDCNVTVVIYKKYDRD